MSVEAIFSKLWEQYTALNPKAQQIYDLISARGEQVLNDHVAFRTFDLEPININALAKVFKKHGYKEGGHYNFEVKKLRAVHFEHENKSLPKVFISELITSEFSDELQQIARGLVDQVTTEQIEDDLFCASGRVWKCSYEDYVRLNKESEYAAWLSAFGFCANHFTVNVNVLKSFDHLTDLNSFIKENGFVLNSSGGEIKGTPEVYLEQSSTMADEHEISFTDGGHTIPTCYYEFALRYPDETGGLYQGFVAKSADKIFESTNKQ